MIPFIQVLNTSNESHIHFTSDCHSENKEQKYWRDIVATKETDVFTHLNPPTKNPVPPPTLDAGKFQRTGY